MIAILVLTPFFYLVTQGWKYPYLTRVTLVIYGSIFVTVVVILFLSPKPDDKVKKITIKEEYPYFDALLLVCVAAGNNKSRVDLKSVLHNADYIDRKIPTIRELERATIDLLSMRLITFKEKKYQVTEQCHHSLRELFQADRNPSRQTQFVHAMINTLDLKKISPEEIEIDFFSQEEYESAWEAYHEEMRPCIEAASRSTKSTDEKS